MSVINPAIIPTFYEVLCNQSGPSLEELALKEEVKYRFFQY